MSLAEIQAASLHLPEQEQEEFRHWVLSHGATAPDDDYQQDVREAVAEGLKPFEEGRTMTLDEARRRLGLPAR